MYEERVAYLLIEVGLFGTLYIFCKDTFRWRSFLERKMIILVFTLFGLWFVIDQAALALDLWAFLPDKNIGLMLLGLPLEEYLLFCLHTLLCYMLVEVFYDK